MSLTLVRLRRSRADGVRACAATSQLFSGQIKVEGDHMPASSDGLIADVFVAAFQTSIDDLLQAARCVQCSVGAEEPF